MTCSRPSPKKALLIGNGWRATMALRDLAADGFSVRWFTTNTDVAEELLVAARPGWIEVIFREISPSDVDDASRIVTIHGDA